MPFRINNHNYLICRLKAGGIVPTKRKHVKETDDMNKSLKSEWKKPDLEIIGIDPKDIITISVPGATPGSPPGSTPGTTLPFDPW